jgi:heme/copper-type cytochrome/quinol oxidase subunit 3
MDIPYTVEPRPDTGLYNGKLGMWLFLASEVMLFGAMFSTYVLLRINAVEWPSGPEVLNVPLATLNTLLLVTSSFMIVLAWNSLKAGNYKKFQRFMWITMGLGALFLIIKFGEYADKIQHDHLPSTSTFYAIYFALTGLHVLHLFGGILVLLFHTLFGKKLYESKPGQFVNRIEVTALYWHFVDLVWLVMFPTLYLS